MGKLTDLVLDQQHESALAAVEVVFAREPDRLLERLRMNGVTPTTWQWSGIPAIAPGSK